ncbi:MAG TPA: hypothetical protein VFL95_02260 [Gemmatimonadales bacterium]|nr:hypothetical protein [Gemmatimonadales bacterium]
MRRIIGGMLLIAGLAGCRHNDQPPRKQLTERQRDSAIGESKLPGAAGVKGALRVSDSAAARRAREDSIIRSAEQ